MTLSNVVTTICVVEWGSEELLDHRRILARNGFEKIRHNNAANINTILNSNKKRYFRLFSYPKRYKRTLDKKKFQFRINLLNEQQLVAGAIHFMSRRFSSLVQFI